MSAMKQELNITRGLRTLAPDQHYSTIVNFMDEVARGSANEVPTSVDIFSNGDNKWYCQVRRGEQRSKPMGPYTRQRAEQIQDARKMLIAKRGTARLVFE